MILTLEGPHDDEPLMGMVGRALDAIVVGDRKRVGLKLAGTYGANLRLELPTHLGTVAKTLGRPIGLTIDDLIARTTSLPLYAPFLSAERLAKLRDTMIGDGSIIPSSVLGLHADRTRAPRWLRFCPFCRQQDIEKHGFSWWRRTHQARGVEICPIHNSALVESQFLRGGSWRMDYPLVDDAKTISVGLPPDDLAFAIARDVRWLLFANLPALGPAQVRAAYFESAETKGFIKGNRLCRSDFLHAMAEAHDKSRLRRLGLWFDAESPYSWPAKIVVGAGECHPPLRHLCLIRFLGQNAKSFTALALAACPRLVQSRGGDEGSKDIIRRLWPDRSVSLNQIVHRVGANYATVRTWASSMGLPLPRFVSRPAQVAHARHRAKIRAGFIRLANGRSRTRTRYLKWLSRNDGKWLKTHLRRKNVPAAPRIDWPRRDVTLARLIPVAIARLRAYRPFRKITRGGLAKELRCEGALQRAGGRLPMFEANTARRVESVRAFTLRRIRTIRREKPGLPRWRLRELASIPRPLPNDPAIRAALGYTLSNPPRPPWN
jgi:hypothetical protein